MNRAAVPVSNYEDSLDINLPESKAPTIPQVIIPSDQASNGDSTAHSEDESSLQEESQDRAQEVPLSRRSKETFFTGRDSPFAPAQKRPRSNADSNPASFKSPNPFPQAQRPSTGVPARMRGGLFNSPASKRRDSTSSINSDGDVINSIVRNSKFLAESVQSTLSNSQFKMEKLIAERDNLCTELGHSRKELEGQKNKIDEINRHMQIHKKINEIYEAE